MKKAVLAVSFGTSHRDTLKLTIEKIENKIQEEFKDYEVVRAFTAHKIIKKLKERDNLFIDNIEEALEKLKNQVYEEVIVQPLHIIPGEEYDYIKSVVKRYEESEAFEKLSLGRPALFFQGDGEGVPDDYKIFIDAIEEIIPKDKAIVFMGHGTFHLANAFYGCLQSVLRDCEKENVYIGTVENYPTLDNVINKLKKDKVKDVILAPLLLVCGDHAKNDMAGDEEDSWKSILTSNGFNVEIHLHGLGEIEKFQDIYINHVKDAIDEKYKGVGKTKKGKAKR